MERNPLDEPRDVIPCPRCGAPLSPPADAGTSDMIEWCGCQDDW